MNLNLTPSITATQQTHVKQSKILLHIFFSLKVKKLMEIIIYNFQMLLLIRYKKKTFYEFLITMKSLLFQYTDNTMSDVWKNGEMEKWRNEDGYRLSGTRVTES